MLYLPPGTRAWFPTGEGMLLHDGRAYEGGN